jgi:hypothetical protein
VWRLLVSSVGLEGARRIVEATRIEKPTEEADLGALVGCLALCKQWHTEACTLTAEERRKLGPLQKTAKRLALMLRQQQSLLRNLDHHRASIDKLIQDIDADLQWQNEGPATAMQQSLATRSPFEWISGNHLADVYHLIFDRKPSYSGDGPYVRFVEATLIELGITNNGRPYSRASISKARKDDETGASRRESGSARRARFHRWRQSLLIQACVENSSEGNSSRGSQDGTKSE